jgi:hypothetical protein
VRAIGAIYHKDFRLSSLEYPICFNIGRSVQAAMSLG